MVNKNIVLKSNIANHAMSEKYDYFSNLLQFSMAKLENKTKLSNLVNLHCQIWQNWLLIQPRGVMVTQVVLVHLFEVRALAGLPFFYIFRCRLAR